MQRIRQRRSPAIPLQLAAWSGAAAVVWLWWHDLRSVSGSTNGVLGAGRLAGLLAGYAMALVVLQMARVPALERRVGSDRVSRWHARSGRYALTLILTHVFLTMWGFARQAGKPLTDIVQETVATVNNMPDMGMAAIGMSLLVVIGLISLKGIRRRLPYDLWYHIHVLTYGAFFLTFWHQLSDGTDFAVEPAAIGFWYALYGSVTALVLWYRILTPLRLNLRHRMHVLAVIQETPDIMSVLIGGRRLHRLGAQSGQFLRWRFLTPGLRFSSHPYSLSAPPRPDVVRITVKASGNHSARLRYLSPGARVWAEGPYGSLTSQRRKRDKVLLIAGGVGITPMRTLFQTLPGAPGAITLLYRASTTEDLALWGELTSIAKERCARLFYAINGPDGARPVISAESLRQTIPDIDCHDVYLCGPSEFSRSVYGELLAAGVPANRIHQELFAM
ncbi:ferredoxin reductase family protein [Streptomyces sp. NPDC001139]